MVRYVLWWMLWISGGKCSTTFMHRQCQAWILGTSVDKTSVASEALVFMVVGLHWKASIAYHHSDFYSRHCFACIRGTASAKYQSTVCDSGCACNHCQHVRHARVPAETEIFRSLWRDILPTLQQASECLWWWMPVVRLNWPGICCRHIIPFWALLDKWTGAIYPT